MVTATKPTVTEPKEKKDWLPIVAVGAGVVGVGVGLYLYLKKKGVAAGSKLKAHFTFDYSGAGGTYLLQVSLGHIRAFIFDHVEGLTWTLEVELPSPKSYEFDVIFTLPEGLAAGSYDGEALIRTSEMDWLEYFVKVETKGAIIVSK